MVFFFQIGLLLATAGITSNLPWSKDIFDSASGTSEMEASYLLKYEFDQQLKSLAAECAADKGKYHFKYGHVRCERINDSYYDCSGSSTAYCEVP
jgi:hypothetical protein